MLFPTTAFAAFFTVAFLVNWLLRPRHDLWRFAMIALSFFFYGYWNARFTGLLAASIIGNWLGAHAVAADRVTVGGTTTLGPSGRRALHICVALNLIVLGFFKYYGFFATSVTNLLDSIGIGASPPLLEILLPVGISFFTFQAISYVIDVSRGEFDTPMSLLDVAFYLAFFPQLVAGPIVRAVDMAEQIKAPPDPRRIPTVEALWLIAGGLFKKVVVSSYLSTQIVDPVFAVPSQYSRWEVLFAIYGYAVQIFADFSGYTDIAIGCALLLGFRFPQNFDSPYRALSIQDFWRRWHITLSSWLRDYLYIPLGGNRGGTLLTYRNLWLTMVLGGLWHGAAWNFVLWGAIHGTALAVERLLVSVWRPLGFPPTVVAAAKWLVTFHIVCFAWIFFRASDATLAFEMVGRIVDGGPSTTSLVSLLLVAVVVAMVASQLVPQRYGAESQRRFGEMPIYVQGLTLALLLTAIDVFGPEGVAPFIYFQF